MNKKVFLSIVVMSLVQIACFNINTKSYAVDNGILLNGSTNRDKVGSNYWHTSNLREWLNSSDEIVNYTNNTPTSDYFGKYAYDQQAGFLTNFTESEQNGIAITELKTLLTPADASALGISGGAISGRFNSTTYIPFNLPNFLGTWDGLAKKSYNDKIFILSAKEISSYYQDRGWSVMKEVTPQVRQKYGITNTIDFWLSRNSRTEITEEKVLTITNIESDPIIESTPNAIAGISPAMHLKPTTPVKRVKEYQLNNIGFHQWTERTTNLNASALNIGDIIEYGTYLGEPIQWRVINKTSDGYPLLSTEYLIDLKAWDAPGDRAWSISNIQFDSADVVADDNYVHNIQNNSDNKLPTIKVTNEDELYTRQIDEFTLNLEVTDESGINRIILPNGNVIKNSSSNISYVISKNGFYNFQAIDNYGNHKNYIVPVGNINLSTSIVVDQSETNWTNKNVDVTIKASNDVSYERDVVNLNGRDWFGTEFPNYTSYAGKKFKLTADIELNFANKDMNGVNATIGFSYSYTNKSGDDFIREITWVGAKVIPLTELANGKTNVEIEYTIPENYFGNLKSWLQLDIAHDERAYSVKYSNIKYELLDNDDFAITKIELPNGQSVAQKQYSYTVTEEGEKTLNYKVHDNRGMISDKTIVTKIDKTNPSLTITGNPTEWTNKDVVLSINSSDNLSGLKELVTPKDVYTFSGNQNHDTTMTVNQNNTYVFKLVDRAGNETIQSIYVSKIDKVSPTINYTKDISANKKSGFLNINVVDSVGEIDYIELPNGERTTQTNIQLSITNNGLYPIKAVDKAGNVSNLIIEVNELETDIVPSNIDKIEYKLSGATIKDWTVYDEPFYITNEGITTITARAYDKAGNLSNETTSIVKIDKTKPNNNSILIELKQ